jgi:YD repeat-containing protein
MRKLALLAATCAAALAATGAGAAAPEHLTVPIQDTFYAPFMSDACGVPVTITLAGTARVRLERNDAGLVVREHDVMPSFTAVFESPTDLGGTGRSFTQHSPGVATFDYGAGATIGSTAVVTFTGLAGQAAGPGSAVSAGLQRLIGTVAAFSPEGIPIVDFDGPILAEHGSWPSFFDIGLPQRCEALGGSLQL